MSDDNKVSSAAVGGIVFVIVYALIKGIMSLFGKSPKNKSGKTENDGAGLSVGDIILWEGEKYKIEAIQLNYKNGENLYAVCRMEPVDSVNIKVKCLKISAKPGELKKVN